MGSELDNYTGSHNGKKGFSHLTACGASGTKWHVANKKVNESVGLPNNNYIVS